MKRKSPTRSFLYSLATVRRRVTAALKKHNMENVPFGVRKRYRRVTDDFTVEVGFDECYEQAGAAMEAVDAEIRPWFEEAARRGHLGCLTYRSIHGERQGWRTIYARLSCYTGFPSNG